MRYEDGTAYTYLPGVQTLEDYLWFLEDLRWTASTASPL